MSADKYPLAYFHAKWRLLSNMYIWNSRRNLADHCFITLTIILLLFLSFKAKADVMIYPGFLTLMIVLPILTLY